MFRAFKVYAGAGNGLDILSGGSDPIRYRRHVLNFGDLTPVLVYAHDGGQDFCSSLSTPEIFTAVPEAKLSQNNSPNPYSESEALRPTS